MEESKPREVTARITWGRFQEIWFDLVDGRETTVEELVSCLHLGGEVPFTQITASVGTEQATDQAEILNNEVSARGRFFLGVWLGGAVECEQAQIAAVQTCVVKVLPPAKSPYILATTHRALLTFFARPELRAGLLCPPYPQFIQGYLKEVHDRWLPPGRILSFTESRQARLQALREALQADSANLIRAMCQWGMANELVVYAVNYETPYNPLKFQP